MRVQVFYEHFQVFDVGLFGFSLVFGHLTAKEQIFFAQLKRNLCVIWLIDWKLKAIELE